jgi:uncharacterized protein (DUF58 family)
MEKTWTKSLLGFLAIASSFAVLAFLSGTLLAALLVIFPLLYVGIMYILDEESSIHVSVEFPPKLKVGDEFEVKASISINRGAGIFLFELPFFDFFKLTDGSNVRVVFKGLRRRNYDLTYKMKALRRGSFDWKEVKYTYNPTMGILNSKEGKIPCAIKVDVLPNIEILRKKGLRIRSTRLNPRNARSRIGPASTDFDSIRAYTPGDPYRTINWKASARSASGGSILVNQYEREGLHSTIFAIDNSSPMRQGTKEENPLESGINMILSFSNLLLNYQYNVGIWVMQKNRGIKRDVVVPGSGMEQYLRIRRRVMLVEAVRFIPGAYPISREFASVARETVPSIFLVTSLVENNLPQLKAMLKIVRSVSSKIVLVDILPYSIFQRISPYDISSIYTEAFSKKAKRNMYREISGLAEVVPWDPGRTSYGRIISRLTASLR